MHSQGNGVNLPFHRQGRQRRERIREFKAIDKERAENLPDIKRKFKNVQASANNLIMELQTLNQTTKEGAEMMKIMVNRFNKVKAENDALR